MSNVKFVSIMLGISFAIVAWTCLVTGVVLFTLGTGIIPFMVALFFILPFPALIVAYICDKKGIPWI